jgi:hypothetical protein
MTLVIHVLPSPHKKCPPIVLCNLEKTIVPMLLEIPVVVLLSQHVLIMRKSP